MEVEIYWTDFAKKELNKIFDYYHQKVNLKLARKLTTQIVSDTDILKTFPEIGTREENLKLRPQKWLLLGFVQVRRFRVSLPLSRQTLRHYRRWRTYKPAQQTDKK